MISIFTSSYNHSKYLGECIESVLSQSYSNFEYLLYDDGSTDNSWDIIKKYAKMDSRIRAFKLDKNPNLGVVINRSLQAYVGDAWLWCPSDDFWMPNLLEEKVEFHKQYPNCVSYSYWYEIDEKGTVINRKQTKNYTPEEFSKEVWVSSPIGFTGIWIPRMVFEEVGAFPEHLQFSEDFYWMIKATIDGVNFRCIPKYLYKKRKHSNRTTNRNIHKILENIPVIRTDLMNYKKKKEDCNDT